MEKLVNPCYSCSRRNQPKTIKACLECKARFEYLDSLEGEGFNVTPLRRPEAKISQKALLHLFPMATAGELGLPECSVQGCHRPIHARGKCANCYWKEWMREYPGWMGRKDRKKRSQCTLTLDFGRGLGTASKRGTRQVESRMPILEDLVAIAREELRTVTTQAMFFIQEGVRRWIYEHSGMGYAEWRRKMAAAGRGGGEKAE